MKSLQSALLGLLIFLTVPAFSQTAYQMPPKVIADMIDAPPTPSVNLSPDLDWMLLMERSSYPSIEDLAQDELRLAGLRINPNTSGPSRSAYITGLKLRNLSNNKEVPIKGLPENPKLSDLSWSPDGAKIAFTHTTPDGIELWMADLAGATAKALTRAEVNDVTSGNAYTWMPDSQSILYAANPAGRGDLPKKPKVPTGPIIQENMGRAAPVRTYQDLLENSYDEAVFAYLATVQLKMLDLASGQAREFGQPAIYTGYSPSPDGSYVMLTAVHQPFSYIVPYYLFPQTVAIFDRQGAKVQTIAEIPLADNIPKGFDATRPGRRNFTWRADAPAALYWVEAQDEGDPKKETDVRDRVYSLNAPFTGDPKPAADLQLRYAGITWGNDGLALITERWRQNRRMITSKWAPADPGAGKTPVFDRSYEDRYNDPGDFVTAPNKSGRSVLLTGGDGHLLYLTGQGASPEGNRPFIDEFNLATGKARRLWRSEAPYYEIPVELDLKKNRAVTRRESVNEPPNYFVRDLKSGKLTQLTSFDNPYKALEGVTKELVKYQRDDGIELTGNLYLPAGYNKEKDGPLPVFMWAYPREYKSADAASQVTGSPYEFIRPSWGSPIFWVARGYAVFDNFAMPIIGEGEEEPNETFVPQLQAGAEAAVNKIVEMGVADRNRLAVGGHSYGAFMTANLLAHTDLFAAGIARSGAYNRTLTPFGFQSEERTYWEAPEVYYEMSPFNFADKIKEPLLMIHGEADNNSGTFPIQSERFYAALKGHGATVRLVKLPAESHGYQARESIMHMFYEMDTWLDKFVKNKGKEAVKP